MGHYRENRLNGMTMEFPRTGFWIIHVIGAIVIFFLGMRFAFRRGLFFLMAYRLLRILKFR